VILAGTTAGTIRASEVNQTGSGNRFYDSRRRASLPGQLSVPGLHMVQNALLAVAVGRVFGLSLEEMRRRPGRCSTTKGALASQGSPRRAVSRRQLQRKSRFMKAALRTLV